MRICIVRSTAVTRKLDYMSPNNQTCIANPDNLKSPGASTKLSAGGASLRSRMKTVSMAALALALPAAVALAPIAAQAATDTWSGTTSNAWETAGNWSGGVADHHFGRRHRQSHQQPGPAK